MRRRPPVSYTEASSALSSGFRKFVNHEPPTARIRPSSQRPKRADARRNYDKLIAAAREAFTEHGTAAVARGHRPPRRRRHRHALPPLPDPPGPARGRLPGGGRGDLPLGRRATPTSPPWEALTGLAAPVRRLRRHQAGAGRGADRLRRHATPTSSAPAATRSTAPARRCWSARRRPATSAPDVDFTDVGRMVSGIAAIRTRRRRSRSSASSTSRSTGCATGPPRPRPSSNG